MSADTTDVVIFGTTGKMSRHRSIIVGEINVGRCNTVLLLTNYQNPLYQHDDGSNSGPMQSMSVQSGQTPAAIYSPRPPLSTGVAGVASALLQGRQNGVVVMMDDILFVCIVM